MEERSVKLLLGLVVALSLSALGCWTMLGVPNDLRMVVVPSDFQGPCGRYSWGENTIYIKENCSWAVPTEANEGRTLVVFHELCHAHQNIYAGGAKWWAGTEEGRSYAAAIQGHGFFGGSLIEDFARACGRYYFDLEEAVRMYPYRVNWMIKNLPSRPPEIPE